MAEIIKGELAEDQPAAEPNRAAIWVRGLYMLLFLLITRVTELIVGVVILIQFLIKLISGKTNGHLLDFGAQLSEYLYSIVQFQTFNSEKKPFPFDSWPSGKGRSSS